MVQKCSRGGASEDIVRISTLSSYDDGLGLVYTAGMCTQFAAGMRRHQ